MTDYFCRILPSASGALVEAGAYKGGSTAKLSLVASLIGRRLIVFDSFKGLPDNKEVHSYLHSKEPGVFLKGMYKGTLAEVKQNVARYGNASVCTYHAGWFEKTMFSFQESVAGIFLDVDLVSSTRTCLKYLYPALCRGGICFSHDGHLLQAGILLKDRDFWEQEVRAPQPKIYGLGKKKLMYFIKRRACV